MIVCQPGIGTESQKSDDMWAICCYTLPKSGQGIHTWYNGLDGEIRAAIAAALESLAEETSWEDLPQFKRLRGKCRCLCEIKVDVGKRRFRILGFDGPTRRQFTLLFGFEKPLWSINYGPACAAAHHRKRGVIRDARRAAPCQFP